MLYSLGPFYNFTVPNFLSLVPSSLCALFQDEDNGPPSPSHPFTRPRSPPPSKIHPLLPPGTAPTGNVDIRRDYNPKAPPTPVVSMDQQPSGPGQFLISPITGEKIPAHKMEEHMRYSKLLNFWYVTM